MPIRLSVDALTEAPTIIGKALNWKALRRPTPSATNPLNRDPIKAPPKQVLTTRPSAMVFPLKPRSIDMLSRVSLTTLCPEKRHEFAIIPRHIHL
jgi:hypothetical protein